MEREARSHYSQRSQSSWPRPGRQAHLPRGGVQARGAGAGTLTGEAKQEKGSCLARKQRGCAEWRLERRELDDEPQEQRV